MIDKPEPVKSDSDPMIAATEELFAPGITQTPPKIIPLLKEDHSPIPWRVSYGDYEEAPNSSGLIRQPIIVDDNRSGVAECSGASPSSRNLANSKLAVRAVNAHDALVSACEAASILIQEKVDVPSGIQGFNKLLAALSLAKGGIA